MNTISNSVSSFHFVDLAIMTEFHSCETDWFRFAGNCYMISKDHLSWQDSDEVCKRKGAELASFHSRRELSWIAGKTIFIDSYKI